MKGIFILIFTLITLSGACIAGNSTPPKQSARYSYESSNQNNDSVKIWDKLDIQSEPRIKELLEQQVRQNKKNNIVNGYRLQIYFGSGPNAHAEAMKVRTEFLSSNPDIKAYLIFKSPDFKVLVGNFRTKSEALKLQKALYYQFPNSFIVSDEIALPELTDSK